MQFKEDAILLSAESKPYSFGGNEGVSHKIRLSIGGEVYVANSTPEQVLYLESKVKSEGVATIELQSRKEKLSLKLISFV